MCLDQFHHPLIGRAAESTSRLGLILLRQKVFWPKPCFQLIYEPFLSISLSLQILIGNVFYYFYSNIFLLTVLKKTAYVSWLVSTCS